MLDQCFKTIRDNLTNAELIGWLKGHLIFLKLELENEERIELIRGNGADIIEFFKAEIISTERQLSAAIDDKNLYEGFGDVVPNPAHGFRVS